MTDFPQLFDPVLWCKQRDELRDEAQRKTNELTLAAKTITAQAGLTAAEIPSLASVSLLSPDALLVACRELSARYEEVRLAIQTNQQAQEAERRRLEEEARAKQRVEQEEQLRRAKAARRRKMILGLLIGIILVIASVLIARLWPS